MLAKVIIKNGVKKIQALTADTGTGAPVGTIIPMYKKSSPSGYLYCDGSTFDETAYPLLYAYLGTNVLPDYREFALVGAEENTTDVYDASTNPTGTIHDHDVYTEGQAKDDQLQDHHHKLNIRSQTGDNSGTYNVARGAYNQGITGNDTGSMSDGRRGKVTRGKRKAVFFYIKATSGLSENQQDNVINTLNEERSYSTEEVNTGKKWIDGKPIYQRVVDIGALPNATTKTVAHNISNYGVFTTIKGIAFNSAKTAQIELPYITANNINTAISIEINATDVQIISGINRSSLSGYAILEYTKN